MSIGNTGKRAQMLGKKQKSRYQVNYQIPAQTPLLSPRQRVEATAQRTPEPPANIIVDPPVLEHTLQREAEVEEVSSPVENSENQESTTPEISPKTVADKVFTMLKWDMRLDRERRGKSRF